jgi:hypothetical protein
LGEKNIEILNLKTKLNTMKNSASKEDTDIKSTPNTKTENSPSPPKPYTQNLEK